MNNRFSLKRKLHYTQSKPTTYPIDFISDSSELLKLSADALSVSLALGFPRFPGWFLRFPFATFPISLDQNSGV